MRLVPSLLLLAALPTVAWSQNIAREYDRFKDRSSNTIKFELSSIEQPGRRGVTFDLSNIVAGNRATDKSDTFTINAMVTYDMRYNAQGFYPEITDGCERAWNSRSRLATLRRILGLWNRSTYSNTSVFAASSVRYFVR